ncbi:uncharacterized protein LOC143449687 isoform X2 [Clavelina lepadiformis]|uniref:uncharacterized protein LOC143449687 isoform X2 n=1 Tax=Clavelina lepadiformis TaxID=159417 RepID=UPI004040F3DB
MTSLTSHLLVLCLVYSHWVAVNADCQLKKFETASIATNPTFSDDEMKLFTNQSHARHQCIISKSCKAVTSSGTQDVTLHFASGRDDFSIKYDPDKNAIVWIKICGEEGDYRLIKAPGVSPYYEPVAQGTLVSWMTSHKSVVLKQTPPGPSPLRIIPTGKYSNVTKLHGGYSISISEIPLPSDVIIEGLFTSWCTNGKCEVGPRTYYHPVTSQFSILGFTDDKGSGHVFLLDQSKVAYEHVTTKVGERRAAIGGLHAFHDRSFAVVLFVDSENLKERKLFLRFYRSDLSTEWEVLLNSAVSVPDREVGDFRLSYGDGHFLVYFSVLGTENFASGTNGEQITFVDEMGNLKTTSYEVPGQKFVRTGDAWGCSHSLAQLTRFHSSEQQFITVCSADLFPKGISAGDSVSGVVLFRADGNGRGLISAQLGQLAEANDGFKLIFNAETSECCPSEGVGFVTIYNDQSSVTGRRQFENPVWLTSTNGSAERDPVIARTSLGPRAYSERESYLIGWRDRETDQYKLGLVNTFGAYRKRPIDLSNFKLHQGSPLKCDGNCVMWGKRDDSMKTLPSGHVGWIYASPNSRTIWMYDVFAGNQDTTGWSLWSGWSRCSRSCGAGFTTRVRSCLSGDCPTNDGAEEKDCNTHECTVPIACTYDAKEGQRLDGDLFVNGARQFGFTLDSAKAKCSLFGELCTGISRTLSGGFYFYFLKTSTRLIDDLTSASFLKTCQESPGWLKWSTWSGCSASCGGGAKFRTRYCDGDSPGSEVCLGESEEVTSCNSGRCPVWSEWTPWNLCSTSCDVGVQSRSRNCIGDYPDRCGVLVRSSSQERACSLGACPRYNPWTEWSGCSVSCGPGFQERTRICLGDFPCPLIEGLGADDQRDCFPGVCPYWSEWSHWSFCEATCGASFRSRTRQCLGDYPPEVGCPLFGEPLEVDACSLGECPYWGKWGSWVSCSSSCGDGVRSRSRECIGDFPLQYCAPGSRKEEEGCNLGECARWGDWSPWTECSATCGPGSRIRSRKCLGDFPCPKNEAATGEEECSLGTCVRWSTWASWGPCTVTCGSGAGRSRSRQCLGDFPDLCNEEVSSESGLCEDLDDCPRWSIWSQWSGCSMSCDVGTTARSRTCAAANLETCDVTMDDVATSYDEDHVLMGQVFLNNLGHYEQTQSRDCLLGRCSYWLDWNTWSPCSVTCNEGSRSRSRDCFGEFPHMCRERGSSVQSEGCSRGWCGVWSSWQSWGECSASCGAGTWTRHRECVGDFPDTCVGSVRETVPCDVRDCVRECERKPCKNGGICRENEHLTRLYHCTCPQGWIGRDCEHAGPDLMCGSDVIAISFNRQVVAEEGLISRDPSLVGLASRDSIACTSIFDNSNQTDVYLVVVPSPVDHSCGSTMEVTPAEYRIRNQVIWEIQDAKIRSSVVLIDFTCIYQRNITLSSSVTSFGAIAVESYKREIELHTDSGVFDVDISLFRDFTYQRPITAGESPFVSLAEGEVVFISVDLRSKQLLPHDDVLLVMDNCFVTSSQTTREPLMYLLRHSCPVSPLVVVLSNGESRSGRFSVRVFGWTGPEIKVEDVYVHCTVSICDWANDDCKPDCDETSRKKRNADHLSDVITSVGPQTSNQITQSDGVPRHTRQMGALSGNGHPYTSIVQVVPPDHRGEARVNLSGPGDDFDELQMVSAGPFEIVLSLSSKGRKTRENHSQSREVHETETFQQATTLLYLGVFLAFFLFLTIADALLSKLLTKFTH